MTGVAKDWLVVAAFFVGFFIFTFAETIWLTRRTGADIPRSLLVTFTSNIFAITVGYFFSFLIVGVMFAAVWDESINEVPAPNAFLWVGVILASTVPILLLALMKRLFLKFTKIETIGRPWLYAFVAAIVFQVSVLILPILAGLYF